MSAGGALGAPTQITSTTDRVGRTSVAWVTPTSLVVTTNQSQTATHPTWQTHVWFSSDSGASWSEDTPASTSPILLNQTPVVGRNGSVGLFVTPGTYPYTGEGTYFETQTPPAIKTPPHIKVVTSKRTHTLTCSADTTAAATTTTTWTRDGRKLAGTKPTITVPVAAKTHTFTCTVAAKGAFDSTSRTSAALKLK